MALSDGAVAGGTGGSTLLCLMAMCLIFGDHRCNYRGRRIKRFMFFINGFRMGFEMTEGQF
ncbi:hypothetical protein TMES_09645 [Thalassospira mesophila]|uniref:Uncharacterized protein n=1 Tax=Thalassospira mesophila TaxID=1293891 RepID=A0A1Y2L307_9PROT|nr:hypothetical protein TMES_09645 [Thalassospira mesophila]